MSDFKYYIKKDGDYVQVSKAEFDNWNWRGTCKVESDTMVVGVIDATELSVGSMLPKDYLNN